MLEMQQWMNLISYRIGSGSEYLWNSYGPNARIIDACESMPDTSIVFDSATTTIYQATVIDIMVEPNRAYRIIHPEYLDAYKQECTERGISFSTAYDGVEYIELEDVDDFIEKAYAIINGEPYDDRISIPLELERDELFQLMYAAHLQDVTLNQFITHALTYVVNNQ